MFKADELSHIVLAIIIIAFVISLTELSLFPTALLSAAILLFINIFAKKIIAYVLDASVKVRIWHMKRFGIYERSQFKYPLPVGLLIPFFLAILSLGRVFWLAITEFEVNALKSRASKKYGLYRFSEMTDHQIALIAALGLIANLVAAVIAYILNFPAFARLSIYFVAFNMIPFSNLDGAKLFFGWKVLYAVVLFFVILSLVYAFLWV